MSLLEMAQDFGLRISIVKFSRLITFVEASISERSIHDRLLKCPIVFLQLFLNNELSVSINFYINL